MNNFIFLFTLFFIFQVENLPDPNAQQKQETKQETKQEEDKYKKYESVVSYFETASENFDKIDYYSKNKIYKGSKEKNLWKLEENDLNAFYIYQAQSISDILYIVEYTWKKELGGLKVEEKEPLEKLVVRVNDLRKKHAIKFEQTLEKHFSRVKDLTESEKQNFITKVKKWNEDQKLIDRIE